MTRMLAVLTTILAFTLGWNVFAQGDGDWGTIKGRITWGGDKLPPQEDIKIPADNPASAQCLQANKGKAPKDEKWVIKADNKGIKNVFVWLVPDDGPKSKKAIPIHPSLKDIPKDKEKVEIDQPACSFIPHVLGLREGQVLLVKNSAPFPHNFKYTGNPLTKNAGGNPLLPPGAETEITLVADRLPILVECNIHPWMRGYIRVFNHPYFAVTDENGAFELKNAPAGSFRLMVWHGAAGWKGGVEGKDGAPVTIKAGGTTDLGMVAFPPPKD